MCKRKLIDFFFLAVALCAALAAVGARAADAPTDRRIALVIGNGTYRSGPLANPVNDARAVANSLKTLGFEVMLKENVDLPGMVDAMRAFYLRAKDFDVRLFYYAGHGVQVKGRNYLVPVNVQTLNEDEVGSKTLDASELLERLSTVRPGFNMVILDACRSNPFLGATIMTADGRAVRVRGPAGRPGLAAAEPAQGTVIAYSTAPGQVAVDGGQAGNGLYTRHLLSNMMIPGLPIEQLFKRVRNAVARDTKGDQVPWESSSMVGEFCFKQTANGGCAANGEARGVEAVAGSGMGAH